jgi:hypothetical protein
MDPYLNEREGKRVKAVTERSMQGRPAVYANLSLDG